MLQINPLDLGPFVGEAALGHQIIDVRTPILDGDVLDFCAGHGDKFDDGAVQGRSLKLWRCATFHIHDLAAFVGDDERALELAKVLRVYAEVARNFTFTPGGT